MSICNRADGDFDEQACLAGGGAPYGEGGGSGGRTIRQGNDGQYYELVGDKWVLLEGMPTEDSLEGDLAAIGLRPLTDDPGYYVSSPDVSPNAEFSSDPRGNLIDNRYINYDEAGGATSVRKGGELDDTERKRVLGAYGYGDGGSDNPYAGAANARAERMMRFNEAMDAIAERRQKIEAYQQAQLKGAGFALPPGQQYFPGLSPTSPLVQSGLIDPMSAQQRINFNPGMVFDAGNQWQQDLARIRAGSGG